MSAIPKRGDLVWLNLNPQAGHEQAGRRPALVLSPESYNRKTGLFLVCPVTKHAKGYPFEVALPNGLPASGVILSDQVKSLDWRAREAAVMGSVPLATISEVLDKAAALLQITDDGTD